MDAERFDGLARSLSRRVSRRSAVRGGGGASLAALLAGGFGGRVPGVAALAARQAADDGDWSVVVRRYQLSGDASRLRTALAEGYVPQLRQQPGFLQYLAVEADDGSLTTIAAFASQQQANAAGAALGGWVDQNLAPLLPAPETTTVGVATVHAAEERVCRAAPPATPTPPPDATAAPTAVPGQPTAPAAPPPPTQLPVCTDPGRPGVGCPCTTGVRDACGQTTLVCCLNDPNGAPGSAGTCVPSSVGCTPLGPPTATAVPCTEIGCLCTDGVEGECAPGLVCCQSVMNGGPVAGGQGMCAAADACGNGPCRGDGCPCNGGVLDACDPGLVCCPDPAGAGVPGGLGSCVAADACGPAATAPVATAPAGDDGGGGNNGPGGSDDPPGDDSGGGHGGTDDPPGDDDSSGGGT